MKKYTTLLIALLLVTGASTFAQEKKPQSPPMETVGKVGKTDIVINYSSPSVKEREIFGELVPFDKIWRAGANEATTISFSSDVTINGEQLKAGTYSFFVLPKQDEKWDIIFNSEAKQWGAYKLDRDKDALVIASKTTKIDKVEQLTYSIEGNYIYLDWNTTRLVIKVN